MVALSAAAAVAQPNNIAVTRDSSRGGANPVTNYTVRGTNGGNTANVGSLEVNATQTNSWTITGSVPADCVLFIGEGQSNTQTIDLGEIGIEGQSNLGVDTVFDMRSPISLTVASGTAGCNTANTVSINKDDIRGLVNANPGAYDANQFQANIPYSVTATLNDGASRTISIPTTGNGAEQPLGAWRSGFTMSISAPKAARGLVAGDYEGTVTVVFDTTV